MSTTPPVDEIPDAPAGSSDDAGRGTGRGAPGEPAPRPPAARRLTREQRRRQLIGIGLRMLVDHPIQDLTIDLVAAEAGISRSLLFHYFPTKADFHWCVVEAATLRVDLHTTAADLPTIVRGLVEFIHRRRANYSALLRGGASGDEQRVTAVIEAMRGRVVDRALSATGHRDASPRERLTVRGWLAAAEEMALGAEDAGVTVDDLVALLVEGFPLPADAAARPRPSP